MLLETSVSWGSYSFGLILENFNLTTNLPAYSDLKLGTDLDFIRVSLSHFEPQQSKSHSQGQPDWFSFQQKVNWKAILPMPLSKSRVVWGHTGQHSPGGTCGFSHSSTSWHWISSQRIAPLSQTQIWQGDGFQISRFRYIWPFWVQAISSPSSPWKKSEDILNIFQLWNQRSIRMRKEQVWRWKAAPHTWRKQSTSIAEVNGF